MTSITIVVGAGGFPTPVIHFPEAMDQADVVTLPSGSSPVGAVHGYDNTEVQYVNAGHYNVSSYSIEVPLESAGTIRDVLTSASDQYLLDHPLYDFLDNRICTDYVLYLAEKAIPGSNLWELSRLPVALKDQLGHRGGDVHPPHANSQVQLGSQQMWIE